ncbi:AMP-binding protein [Halodesulfovibrio sp.]|jgi:long-chain acyl-CoA synthetase|uniref:AMP-binding protein n=1 Tax=Halodesulfovibrio sp. TaxID=1912772 RepID=UPI0025DCAEB7|nr:AMP-binding protein [Halodesulfovibrio sp.]MCT4627615.1 AMP-binding protein [Halodesulfovibrio sp.]
MYPLTTYTLTAVLDRSADLFHDQPALSNVGGAPITYKEFAIAVQGLQSLLAKHGIGTGDKVAILSESTPNWGIAYFAITAMGAVAVPILPDFHPDAVHHIIRHSEASAIIVSQKLFSKVEDGQYDELPVLFLMETFSPVAFDEEPQKLKELKKAGLREFRSIMEKARDLTQKLIDRKESEEEHRTVSLFSGGNTIKPDDVAAIIYTSGTTGHSKGVVLTHENIVSNAYAVRSIVEVGPGDRLLSILPLSHTYECTLGLILPLMNGAHIHYMDKPPTARALLPAMAKVQPTVMLSVPLVIEKIFKAAILPKLTSSWAKRMLYKVARAKLHALAGKKLLATFGGSLRLFCIGGAAIAPEVERFLKEANFPYAIGYGLTETSPLLAGTGPEQTRLLSTGYQLQGVELKIDNPHPETGEGEILAKGSNIMKGYYKAPEITKSVFTEDGWFRTGDLGKFDADNFLYIRGRLKNVIVGPSGENIYPEELENMIMQSPWVLETIVYEQDRKLIARIHLDRTKVDDEFGNLHASKLEEKVLKILEEIRTGVNSKVAGFSRIMKVIEQTEPFEKTPTQKIKRYLYVD